MHPARIACHLHDAATDAGYIVGIAGLSAMVLIYCAEVVTRYFLGTALSWANDAFSNVMLITLFAMVPHATRAGRHISINMLAELVPILRRPLGYFAGITGFLVCLFIAWMSLEDNLRQIALQIVTQQNHPVPKIWMSAFITYGFVGAALYFLRGLSPSPLVRPFSWVAPLQAAT